MNTLNNLLRKESSRYWPGAFFLFFLMLLFCHPAGLKASTGPGKDSSKVYALDDPRDPDCPCHHYQELADKEYAKLKAGHVSTRVTRVTYTQRKRFWKHKSRWKRLHRIGKPIDGCSVF
ncbi:MAG TPA: hypothetical protein VNZ86_00605 [Bacteroidia bacterium]|jgi:hypothetical protein|nr:hypothetical protein [Bacteroidia bacterium]